MLSSYMVCFMLYLNEIHGYNIKIVSLSRNVEKFNSRFGVYKNKILHINKSVNEAVEVDCDFIIHAASLASPQYYTVQPVAVILPSLLGTYNSLKNSDSLLKLIYHKGLAEFYLSF